MAKPSKKPNRYEVVTDLRSVESVHRTAFAVDILLAGRPFRFIGRRLIPEETNRVKALMQLALPPLAPAAKPGEEPRYNFDDPDYQQRHERARRQARALALWLAYDCFGKEADRLLAEKKTALPKRPETVEEITEFIESRAMDDDALQALFTGLSANLVEVQEYVNFISGNGSPKS